MSFEIKNVAANRRIVAVTFAVIGFLVSTASLDGFAQSRATLEIKTLSSRADLVSGGDALIEVKAPAGTEFSKLTLTLNNKDVTSMLKPDAATGSFRGLITGLVGGDNTLRATLKSSGKAQATLKVKNYPITGPILSGPHLTPYE